MPEHSPCFFFECSPVKGSSALNAHRLQCKRQTGVNLRYKDVDKDFFNISLFSLRQKSFEVQNSAVGNSTGSSWPFLDS